MRLFAECISTFGSDDHYQVVFIILPSRSLVDEVTGSIGAAEVMQSISAIRAATVTIDAVDGGGVYQQEESEGQYQENRARGVAEGTVKRVRFEEHSRGVYRRGGGKQAED